MVFITGIYGLGENIVQGKVDPDEFHVHKPTFKQGYRAVLRRSLGRKQQRLIYAEGHTGSTTCNVDTTEAERASFCIEDSEVLKLADHAIRIEEHYSRRAGHAEPMDIEWAKDADNGEPLYRASETGDGDVTAFNKFFRDLHTDGKRYADSVRQGRGREDRHGYRAGNQRHRGFT